MARTPPFGLYPSRTMVPAQQLRAGASLALDSPINATGDTGEGARVFRRTLWLPVPSACSGALGLLATTSALSVHFSPAEFELQSTRADWFTEVSEISASEVRIALSWPARVLRINTAPANSRLPLALHRADGEAVTAQATQHGHSNSLLSPPWVGSPLLVRFDNAAGPLRNKHDTDRAQAMKSRPASTIPSLHIAGNPANPRLRLIMEADGKDTLLWQSVLTGEHAHAVSLPQAALEQEWAPALGQVLKTCNSRAKEAIWPLLRLELESDAPCLAQLSTATLQLEAEHQLLAAPLRVDFDGTRCRTHALTLPGPPGGTLQGLTLQGRVRGGEAAEVGSTPLPAQGRSGLLLEPDQRISAQLRVDQPESLAGIALAWYPLSDALTGRLRLLPTDGSGAVLAGSPALLEHRFTLDTGAADTLRPDASAGARWIALRWAALALQAQALCLELVLETGQGVWLTGPDTGTDIQWQRHDPATPRAQRGSRLMLSPIFEWLHPVPARLDAAPQLHGLRFSLNGQGLAVAIAGQTPPQAAPSGTQRFTLALPDHLLNAWPAHPLTIESGTAAQVFIDVARVRIRID